MQSIVKEEFGLFPMKTELSQHCMFSKTEFSADIEVTEGLALISNTCELPLMCYGYFVPRASEHH